MAPLDWGLGHTTRCIPIIQMLLKNDYQIVIACGLNQQKLLQSEFPHLHFIHLPGYNITYSKYKRIMPLKILLQIPKIFTAVRRENEWLKKIIKKHDINAVISDNRYGLYSSVIPCFFITHQLQVQVNISWTERVIQKIIYAQINKFWECWIPDFAGEFNLAGALSHPKKMPSLPTKYIGALSRFTTQFPSPKKYTWCFILSGPEPQRTLLELKIILSAGFLNGTVAVLRGKPSDHEQKKFPENCTVYNHLPTVEFQRLVSESEFIVSRCGYTTVMEMLALKKKCIFIPTPGQTEQEYLARYLSSKRWCCTFSQKENLHECLKGAENFEYALPEINPSIFEMEIKKSLQKFGVY